jgi:uncharacterized membrane protein
MSLVKFRSAAIPAARTLSSRPSPASFRRLVHSAVGGQAAILGTLVTAGALVLGWALIAQHRAYNSRAYDLGYFDQVIWNTAHGRWFETNFVQFNFLGEHFQPVLLLFAALYRIDPSVELLLAVQAGFVAGAAVPLYLAARRVLASATAALLVVVGYLLAPPVHWAALFDFHPEMLGIAAIFSAFALLVGDRPLAAIVALSAVFLLKEDAVLVGGGGAWLIWMCGYRRHALLLLGLTGLYAVIVLGVLMPALRDESPGLLARYGYLGRDPVEMAVNAVRRPTLVWDQLTAAEQRRAVVSLLTSQAWLPLLSPAALAAVPALGANLLSTHQAQQSLSLHYGIYPFTLLLVAAVFGAARLARASHLMPLWRALRVPVRHRATVVAGGLALTQAVAWATDSPLGGRFDPASYRRTPHTDAIERTLALIPPDAPLSAQSNLVPHLSQRRFIRDFPRIDHAEYVVIDLKSWGIWQTTFEIYDRILHELPSLGFCRIVEDDGVELYERRAACPPGQQPTIAGQGEAKPGAPGTGADRSQGSRGAFHGGQDQWGDDDRPRDRGDVDDDRALQRGVQPARR